MSDRVKFRYLFHGTSSVHKASIQESGLLPRHGPIHLTTHPKLALVEAIRTVSGEGYLLNGYKEGVGGSPIIVIIERSAAAKLTLDAGYYDQTDTEHYSPRELRYAFTTCEPIPRSSISLVEDDCLVECDRLLAEIETMTNQPTYKYGLNFDHLVYGRVYRMNT
jgi:hypothetical protein